VSVKAGIRVQDALTIIKVLTAVAISVIGIVVLFSQSDSNSLKEDPFQGFSSIQFGKVSVAFYSGNTESE
jgi:hypothetical protein